MNRLLTLSALALLIGAANASTCAQKTDGASGGPVLDSECSAVVTGSAAVVGSTGDCAVDPCNMSTPADFAACCDCLNDDGTTSNALACT